MAIFEGLASKLQKTMAFIRGKVRVNEKDVKEMMREIKLTLLEADVNYKVVKNFINNVSKRAIGQDVIKSLTPGQQIVKIVHEELIDLMGGEVSKITYSSAPPSIYMLIGLQGSGKTTTAGKLALFLKKDGKRPLLVACDVYRPAAITQLKIIAKQIDIPIYMESNKNNPISISKASVKHAIKNGNDCIIIDTAGRLHIDDILMEELKKIKTAIKPQEILLVVDSMTGQDAVNVATTFNEKLLIDGVILTKLDGDTRGGAALSIKAVTGKPIKYTGIGEKMSDFEPFYPDRLASRILGMGDVLSLIEKVQDAFDEKKAKELEQKIRKQQFSLDDFLEQLQQLKKMGPLNQIMDMIPGINNKQLKNVDFDEKKMHHTEAIIKSMTLKEREYPQIINSSRKKRIAEGSGTNVQKVNKLLFDFNNMKKMMKKMSTSNKHAGMGLNNMPF